MHFVSGLRAGMAIAIGYFPIALTFGLLAKTTGLSMWEATAMSLVVFAGAAQYVSLPLLAKSVDPVLIVLNTFIINIRHLLMSASLNEQVASSPKWQKAIYAFGITDETFSVLATSPQKPIQTSYAIGVAAISYSSWVVFTAVGHVIGANLPLFLQAAMSIALYAMFIALLVPSLKKSKKIALLALTAGLLHSLFYFTGLLSTGWAILASTFIAAVCIELVMNTNPKQEVELDGN